MSSKKATNSEVQVDVYKQALKSMWSTNLDIRECFPEQIYLWISKKATELGVPCTYIAYPFLTACAYALGTSNVCVSETYQEPVILFTLVSGRSGTNKSGSLNIVKRLVESIPNNATQKLFDSGTLEGLLKTLRENNGSVLACIDEFSTFMDNLDKGTNGHAERSRYLSLWSGTSWSKRTKNDGLESVQNPRYHLTSFLQNYYLINHMCNDVHYDGFFSRFLVACPAEVYVTLNEKVGAAIADDPINVVQVVSVINQIFQDGFDFLLDEPAMELFANYHDHEVLEFRRNEIFEDVKSMIMSKSIGNVLRVSGILAAIRTSLELLHEHDLDDDSEMSLSPRDKSSIKVTATDMQRSMNIVRYSVKCLCTITDATKQKPSAKRPILQEMPDAENIDAEFLQLHKGKIQKMLANSINREILFASITKNHYYPQIGSKSSADDGRKFVRALEIHGLGHLDNNGRKFVFFNKENVFAPEQIDLFKRIGIY